MPVTGPASYVICTLEFENHWGQVNEFLPPAAPLQLKQDDPLASDFNVASFVAIRAGLLAARDVIEDETLDLALLRADLDVKKAWLLAHLNMFNNVVRADYGATTYAAVLPEVPSISDGEEKFKRPMIAAKKLWAKMNTWLTGNAKPVITLVDGTTQAVFGAAIAPLTANYEAVIGAEQDLSLAIKERNSWQDMIYPWMKKYRLAVGTRVPWDNALIDTIPELSPSGGPAPDPVELDGAWNVADGMANLNFTESTAPDLKEVEIQYCAGPEFVEELAHVVANIKPGEPRVVHTLKGLGTPGATATFRAYVKTNAGAEAGSNTITISRPAP